jgi:hypothetical protein
VSWILFLVIIFTGFLGLFGDGFISRKPIYANSRLIAEYRRFSRLDRGTDLIFYSTSNPLKVAFENSYLKALVVESIVPKPVEILKEAESTIFSFDLAPGAKAHFILRSQSRGEFETNVKVGSESFPVKQFFYP